MKIMKTTALLLLIFSLITPIKAQISQIYGSYWDGSREILASFDPALGTQTEIDTLVGVQTLSVGANAIDPVNKQYLRLTNLGLMTIDYQTGNVLNTFSLSVNLKGMEYDPGTSRLYGTYWNGSQEMFAFIDISNGQVNNISPLPGVQFSSLGESAFDFTNGRYIYVTNLGLTVIDAQTGFILNTYPNMIDFKGIEYDQISGLLYASEWTGVREEFIVADISTGLFAVRSTLNGVQTLAVGSSTLDPINGLYFRTTNLGLTVIDIPSGSILGVYPGIDNLKGYEFPFCLNSSQPLASPSASICNNDSVMLSLSGTFSQYLWSNGRVSPSIFVNDSSQYSVLATDSSGCTTPSNPLAINIYNCTGNMDSIMTTLDTCMTAIGFTSMAYIDDISIGADSMDLQWHFILNSGDTATLPASYKLNQNGLYSVGIDLSCSSNGQSESFSDLVEVSRVGVNLESQSKDLTYSIYPNPSSGFLNIELLDKSEHALEFRVVDIQGRTINVFQLEGRNSMMDISDLKPGIYFFELDGERNTERGKFIKE